MIIPCKNEDLHLKNTIDNLQNTPTEALFEIIVVDDGSEDHCSDFLNRPEYAHIKLLKTPNIGAAKARNAGADMANGNILVFLDAHMRFEPYWLDRLISALEKYNADAVCPAIADINTDKIAGYGQTWNNVLNMVWIREKPLPGTEVPLAGGCALVLKREVFSKLGGFNKYFEVWGHEDEELSLKLWLFGYRLIVEPEVVLKHFFRPRHPYHVTSKNTMHNMFCMAYLHFNYKRLAKVVDLYKNNPYFASTLTSIILHEDLRKTRIDYLANRQHDDAYFFDKFGIPF